MVNILQILRFTLTLTLTVAAAQPSAAQTFETDVKPIFAKHCAGCHFPDLGRVKAGLDLSTAAGTLAGSKMGPVVTSGDSSASPLIKMLRHEAEPFMPPPDKGEKLSDEDIARVAMWIDMGARSEEAPSPAKPIAEPAPVPSPYTGDTSSHIDSAVSAAAFSPDGSLLALGGLHLVEVYEIVDGAPQFRFELDGHAEMVRALAFPPDGSRLIAAGGLPGRSGEVKIWDMARQVTVRTIEGHRDNVLDIALSPDGTKLATASYDKTVIVWDLETGEALQELTDHVDAVYAVAWSPDGAKLATGAGDRAVKLWDPETGGMLLSMTDSEDAVHALTFSPDGKYLAGAGADKIIRIWDTGGDAVFQQTGTTAGVLVNSTFAHEGSVLRLAYSPGGKTLYSTGEDRRVKAWDTASLQEKTVFEQQADWVQGFALHPDGNTLAVGRYDSTSALYAADTGERLWSDGIEETVVTEKPNPEAATPDTGRKKISSLDVEAVIIRATVPPSLNPIRPARRHRGSEVEVTLTGKNLADAEVVPTHPGITAEILKVEAGPEPELMLANGPQGLGANILDNGRPYTLKAKLTIAEDVPAHRHFLMLRTPIGMSNAQPIDVLLKPDTGEQETDGDTPQEIAWPDAIIGQINPAGDVDRFKVSAEAGQDLVFALTDTGLNADMQLLDGGGAIVAANDELGDASRLAYHVTADGEYVLELRDAELRSGLGYRLHAGPFPLVTSVWPLGIPAGEVQNVRVTGFNLPDEKLEIDPPDVAEFGQTVGLPIPHVPESPIGLPAVAVGPFPEMMETEDAQHLPFPATANGRIEQPGDSDVYRFKAKADTPVYIEVEAARHGSPLDSFVEVLDAEGSLLQRGLIRCVAQTTLTLSGRDSRNAGLRIDKWRDLKIGDYVMVGSEIVRVKQLPDYADEDMLTESYANGQRMGYFGTTPEHHAVDTAVYKVEIHQPEAELAPNGLPVHPLYWRNDDGFFGDGNSNGDSQLLFTAPEDGEYQVRIRDARGAGGERYAYRLTLRPPQPDYDVVMAPYRVNIARNSAVPVEVRVRRKDGFDGPVKVSLHDLPEGFHAKPDTILPGEDRVTLALTANEAAASTDANATFRITAEAELNGQTVERETRMGAITINEKPADLTVNNTREQVALAPGQSVELGVTLDRANEFDSRVPIDVLNLPFGVRIMDTGLNGILVREGETQRRMEIYAEPWVPAMTRTIYIQARIETQTPQQPIFIGKPIELQIGGAEQIAAAE